MGWILVITLFILIAFSVPVSFAIGASAILVLSLTPSLTPLVFVQRTVAGLDSFVILAIPLFILAAEIMNCSGVTDRLIKVCYVLVGHIRGGIAHVNVLVSMIFAGISGSATADTAGIGSILIPSMVKRGYPKDFTISVTAASSTLGQIIPPSIIAVIYASTVGISVGALFLAGIMAGILIGLTMMVISYFYAIKYGYPREERFAFKESMITIFQAVPAFGAPLIIIGGIVVGFFTPTEAAVAAVIYSLALSLFYRTMNLKMLWGAVVKSGVLSSVTTLCIGVAMVFSYLLSYYHIPRALSEFIIEYANNQMAFLFIAFAMFLIIGCFMDATPSIIMLAPIVAPIGISMGVNPIHLGVIVVVTMSLGLVTPPFGLCLLLGCKIGESSVEKVMNVMVVFIVAIIAIIALIILAPGIVLWIPSTLAPNLMP